VTLIPLLVIFLLIFAVIYVNVSHKAGYWSITSTKQMLKTQLLLTEWSSWGTQTMRNHPINQTK